MLLLLLLRPGPPSTLYFPTNSPHFSHLQAAHSSSTLQLWVLFISRLHTHPPPTPPPCFHEIWTTLSRSALAAVRSSPFLEITLSFAHPLHIDWSRCFVSSCRRPFVHCRNSFPCVAIQLVRWWWCCCFGTVYSLAFGSVSFYKAWRVEEFEAHGVLQRVSGRC